MYITQVIARGLKRRDFDVTLDRANVITGDNFAGKTEILDAITLGLVGYSPALGNTPRATFGLCRGSLLEIELRFDTNDRLIRTWWLDGDAVKSKHTIPAGLKNNPLLATMLDANEYFALGPTDRTRYVFANCPVEIVTREEMQRRVDAVVEALDLEPAGVYALAPYFQQVDDKSNERFMKNQPKLTPQEEIATLLELVATDWTLQKNEAAQQQGTINTITAQRADEEPGAPLASLEDERASLTREIEAIQTRKDDIIGSFTKMTGDRMRRAAIAREISQTDKTRLDLVTLKEKLSLIEQAVAGFVPVTMERSQASLQLIADAQARKLAAYKVGAEAKVKYMDADKGLAALAGATVCPFCGATGEGWKELKRAQYVSEIEAANLVIASSEKSYQLNTAEEVAAKTTNADLLSEAKRQNDVIAQAEQVRAAISRLEPSMTKLESLNAELGRLAVDDPALTTKAETIQTELNIKNADLRALNVSITTAAGRAGDLVRMANAEKLRDAAEARKALAAAAGKELKLVQAEMVDGAFKPLLQVANAIFAGVLPFEIEYRDGEIGGRADGVWRGHKTMSGVERLLVYCAIQMALAARSPIRVANLDEMGRLVTKRIPNFACAILGAIRDGYIDQAFLVDPERGEIYTCAQLSAEDDLAFQVIAVS